MSAVPEEFVRRTDALAEEATRPFARSRKIYVEGSRSDIRVPMREISLTDTPAMFGAEKNPAHHVYDTSGPYTDPTAHIDLLKGLPALRARWIEERGDSEMLAALPPSSCAGGKWTRPSPRCASTAPGRYVAPRPAPT